MPSDALLGAASQPPCYIRVVALYTLRFSDLDGLSRFGISDVGEFEFKQIAR